MGPRTCCRTTLVEMPWTWLGKGKGQHKSSRNKSRQATVVAVTMDRSHVLSWLNFETLQNVILAGSLKIHRNGQKITDKIMVKSFQSRQAPMYPSYISYAHHILGHMPWMMADPHCLQYDLHSSCETIRYMGVSINWDTPIAGWFILENPTKMDENWGYPYFRKNTISLSTSELWPHGIPIRFPLYLRSQFQLPAPGMAAIPGIIPGLDEASWDGKRIYIYIFTCIYTWLSG